MPNIRQWINKLYYAPKISFQKTPLEYYVKMLQDGKPFTFSRFGDGEWGSILGHKGANCDGHEYLPELSTHLQNAVKSSYPYIYGIQNYAIKNMGRQIYHFLRRNQITIDWHNSDVFHYANIAGQLNPLIKAMQKYVVVIVGPDYLRPVSKTLFKYNALVEIPRKNCFKELYEIKEEMKAYSNNSHGIIYALSASMASNCIIHDLYPEYGKQNWFIDFGSLWDIYAGVKSRSVYNEYDWDEIIKKNIA